MSDSPVASASSPTPASFQTSPCRRTHARRRHASRASTSRAWCNHWSTDKQLSHRKQLATRHASTDRASHARTAHGMQHKTKCEQSCTRIFVVKFRQASNSDKNVQFNEKTHTHIELALLNAHRIHIHTLAKTLHLDAYVRIHAPKTFQHIAAVARATCNHCFRPDVDIYQKCCTSGP